MKKLFAVTLTCLLMVTMLAACGSPKTETPVTTAAPAETQAAAAPETTAAAETEATAAETEAAAAGFTTIVPGKLVMSTNASFPPYEMVAADGSFEGIDVDVAAAIADKLGLELQIDNMGFDACILAVQQGKSDICMAGLTVTPERSAVMDFTDTYANGVQVVIVANNSDIKTLDDLANDKMIGTQMGTTGYIYCSDTVENGGYGEDHVIPYDDGAAAIQALLKGQIDAVVIDNMPAQEYVAANPGLKILEMEYANEDYAIGIAKGNTELLNAVNAALNELIADGTVQSIVDKYISAN